MKKMLTNFNKLIFESLIDVSKYQFSTNDNGNIFCTFTINNDYVINSTEMNNKITFFITEKNGKSETLSEKEFSFKFNPEYNDFKEALEKYKNKEITIQNNDQSKIEDFSDQVEDIENLDPNVKLKKDIISNGMTFVFKLLNDIAVENYCECNFQYYDDKINQTMGVKSLLFIKPKNSFIIKIIIQNDKGENLEILTTEDFKIKNLEIYEKFKQAITKFEEYLNYQRG